MLLAAVGEAAPAGVALLAVDVRLDRAAVARLHVRHALADREHFDAELVPGNARIAEERHLAEIAAEIGAADADAVHAHERFARPGLRPARAMSMLARSVCGFSSWSGFHECVGARWSVSCSPAGLRCARGSSPARRSPALRRAVARRAARATHFAQLRMLFGIRRAGDGGGDVRIREGELERELARCPRPCCAQCSAARRAAAFTSSGSFSQAGSGAFVSRRAQNGPAFITPTPFAFRYGTSSRRSACFAACIGCS